MLSTQKKQFVLSIILVLSSFCPLSSGVGIAYAATVTLAWDANTEPDLAGYRIHYGTSSGSYQHSVDVQKHTSCSISGLDEGTTYYFAATAYDLEGNESDFSDEVSFSEVIYTIPLQSDASYGNIKSGDQNHIDEVKYSFGQLSGDATLYYEAWDVDFADEVEIILNGSLIGYAPVANGSWGGIQAITLPDDLVNDSSDNYLSFNNPYNPPNQYFWGVRYVSVDAQ